MTDNRADKAQTNSPTGRARMTDPNWQKQMYSPTCEWFTHTYIHPPPHTPSYPTHVIVEVMAILYL